VWWGPASAPRVLFTARLSTPRSQGLGRSQQRCVPTAPAQIPASARRSCQRHLRAHLGPFQRGCLGGSRSFLLPRGKPAGAFLLALAELWLQPQAAPKNHAAARPLLSRWAGEGNGKEEAGLGGGDGDSSTEQQWEGAVTTVILIKGILKARNTQRCFLPARCPAPSRAAIPLPRQLRQLYRGHDVTWYRMPDLFGCFGSALLAVSPPRCL